MGRKAPVKSAHFLRGLTPCRQKFSIAHQFARIAVLQSGADALRQAQRDALEGHNGFILPRRGLRIDVAPAIPFLRFLLRQLEGALRRGKGDNRLMLPAVPLLCSSARRTPMREKRTLPNRAPKPAETATALYPAATAYGLRPTPGQQPWRRQLPRRPPGPSAA